MKINQIELASKLAERELKVLLNSDREVNVFFNSDEELQYFDKDQNCFYYTHKAQNMFDDFYDEFFTIIKNCEDEEFIVEEDK